MKELRAYLITLTIALICLAGVVIFGVGRAHATADVTVTHSTDPVYYGRRYVASVDGPVSLIVLSAQTIYSSGGCVSVYGEAGPHQSGYPIGATCTGPGTIIVDTVQYPTCDQHLTIVADNVVVFDTLLGSGDCTPPTTTTTTTITPVGSVDTLVAYTTTTNVCGGRGGCHKRFTDYFRLVNHTPQTVDCGVYGVLAVGATTYQFSAPKGSLYTCTGADGAIYPVVR